MALNRKQKNQLLLGVPFVGLIVAVETLGIVQGIVVFVIILVGLVMVLGRINKGIEVHRGHNRCQFCKDRIKRAGGSYATTCRKCGQVQPWAKSA